MSPKCSLPHDEELFDELVAIRWRATSSGKSQIEPKEELKNRLGRSPDRAGGDQLPPCRSGEIPSQFVVSLGCIVTRATSSRAAISRITFLEAFTAMQFAMCRML